MPYASYNDAEKYVIGSALQDPYVMRYCGILSQDDFTTPALRTIYESLTILHAAGSPIDLATVDDDLARRGVLAEVGGTAYLIQLAQYVPTTANARAYIDIVKEQSNRRRLCNIAITLHNSAQDGVTSVEQAIDDTRQAMREIQGRTADWDSVSSVIIDTFAAMERRMRGEDKPIGTGIPALDKSFYGFCPGELTVIGARPGGGKSAFAGSVALNAAKHGFKVGVVSLEMSKTQYGQRLLASESDVDSQKIRKAAVEEDDIFKIVESMKDLSLLPIDFMFKCRKFEQLNATVQRRVDEGKLDLLIIDYLQLLRTEQKYKSDYERVTYISQMLKEMTVMLEIPIIALAQLSRAGKERRDKRPILSDLRDSGAIEQDADNVVFLHRPDDAEDKGVDERDKSYFKDFINRGYHYVYLSIEKQRQGPIGSGNILLDPRVMRYTTIERR